MTRQDSHRVAAYSDPGRGHDPGAARAQRESGSATSPFSGFPEVPGQGWEVREASSLEDTFVFMIGQSTGGQLPKYVSQRLRIRACGSITADVRGSQSGSSKPALSFKMQPVIPGVPEASPPRRGAVILAGGSPVLARPHQTCPVPPEPALTSGPENVSEWPTGLSGPGLRAP